MKDRPEADVQPGPAPLPSLTAPKEGHSYSREAGLYVPVDAFPVKRDGVQTTIPGHLHSFMAGLQIA